MRIHHWLTAITSLLAPLAVTTTSLAQPGQAPGTHAGWGPVHQASASQYDMATTPMVPPVYQPSYTTTNPEVLFPPNTPMPEYAPYPAISPHLGPNLLQERHYNQRGLWLREQVPNTRTWYGGVEYLRSYFDAPDGAKVGSRPARIRWDTLDFPGSPPGVQGDRANGRQTSPGGQIGNAGIGLGPYVVTGPGAFPFVFLQDDVDAFVGVVTLEPLGIFPQRNLSVFNDTHSSGLRLRSGFFNGDGTGFGLEGWWGFDENQKWQIGKDNINGVPITQDLIAGVQLDTIPQTDLPDTFDGGLNNGTIIPFAKIGGLPLVENSGVIDTLFPGAGFTGSTMKYDLMYRLDYSAEAGGANAYFYLGTLRRSPAGVIKPYASARYLYINEAFAFTGLDSGFHYEIELEEEPPTFRPDDEVIGPLYPLFKSYLQSTVTSNLAGPELGLRGDIGGGGTLKVWWQGSFGLMANHERVRVHGNNIGNAHFFNANEGDPTSPDDDSGFGIIFGPAFDMFANDTNFSDVETHTHVSPVLNLGLNAELDVFDTVPFLRKVSLFDAAKLTVGYNLLVVGKLARPGNAVRWRGFPEFPSVLVRYDTWDAQQCSIGLTFER